LLNEELILNKNSSICSSKILIKNKRVMYKLKTGILNGWAIRDIIGYINGVKKRYGALKIPIIFDLGNAEIADKLTYIIFECLCDYLITVCKQNVQIFCKPVNSIWTDGIESSPLVLLNCRGKDNIQKYSQKFQMEIYKNHYRRLVTAEAMERTSILSEIMEDIDYFLKIFDVDEESRKEISEVAVELIGNAGEHSKSDCLIDLDVTGAYHKVEGDCGYYGINLVVLNFSEILLGDGIRRKICDNPKELNSRHKMIAETYDKHKLYFNDDYCEQDFFNIASFQHKITGRIDNSVTGGTGLSLLIRSLEDKSDAHMCYVLSGDRVLWFHKEFLEYDNGWIGFNESHQFLSDRPDESSLSFCPMFMPGTAYNLNFVLKKED
jgi:hypothetical protein